MKDIKLKCIYDGPIRGDECSHSIYEVVEPVTVQEFCDYIISNEKIWGTIGIDCPGTIFGDPKVEYAWGKYVDEKRNDIGDFRFPPKIANAYVSKVDWDGGWGYVSWVLTLRR